MAVVNNYVSPLISNPSGLIGQNVLNSFRGGGGERVLSIFETFTIAATDNSLSIYRVFKNLNANIIPLRIMLANTAMVGSSAFNLGLYLPNYGAAVGTGNQFTAAGTLVTARASMNPQIALDGMSAVNINSYYQRLFEIAGETETAPLISTTRVDAFDLCLGLTTSGLVVGTVSVLMDFVNA